jgi:hypothetical protein
LLAELVVSKPPLIVEHGVSTRHHQASFAPQLGSEGPQDRQPGCRM